MLSSNIPSHGHRLNIPESNPALAEMMDPTSTVLQAKCANSLDVKGDGGGSNRLSVLPAEILDYILSLLPFKDVVRMTVLSTRWSLSRKEDLLEALPIFNHLTELELSGVGTGLNCKGPSAILRRCPQLRTLKFSGGLSDLIPKRENILEPMPSCFVTHLKKIEIMYFEGTPEDMGFMSILLKAAMVLEEVVITFTYGYDEENEELVNQIMMLPTGSSESCKFTFTWIQTCE